MFNNSFSFRKEQVGNEIHTKRRKVVVVFSNFFVFNYALRFGQLF